MRKKNQSARIENAEGEIDTTFWAEAAAERADGMGGESAATSRGLWLTIVEPASPMPFESQFFADGDNDGDDDITDIGDFAFVDDALDEPSTPLPSGPGDMDGEDDNLWQGSQTQIKRARPENVTFAKRAKRVDVKRLKDDIWVGLKSLVPKPVDAEGEMELDDSSDPETETLTPVGEAKTFNNIITDLRRTYPKDKMSEISTSFCFICLLHLANEEGLMLEAARFDGLEGEDVGCQGVVELDMASLENEGPPQQKKRKGNGPAGDGIEKVVGELQALRVYKVSLL
jgi:condensin complex subunit 2